MKKCPNCGYCEPPPYSSETGEKMRRMRESLGISLAALGKLCGQNPSMLGMVERGERKARRRVVDPAISVLRERAAAMREAMEAYDKGETQERGGSLCVPGQAGMGDSVQPAELPTAG